MGYLVLEKSSGNKVVLAGTYPFIQVTKADQKQELLGADTFTISVQSTQELNFEIGDSIVAFGCRYWINCPQNITHTNSGDKHVYDIEFEGIQYRFINAVLFDMGISQYATTTSVSYCANLLEICRLIVTCVNYNENKTLVVLDEANIPETERMDLSFSDTNCLSALQTICGTDYFNVFFKLTEQANGTYILRVNQTVGQLLPYKFKVGQRGGAYEIKRSKDSSSSSIFTRLYAYGSSSNIPTSYRNYSTKLRLPVAVPDGFTIPNEYELVNDAERNLTYLQLKGVDTNISYVKTYDKVMPERISKVTKLDDVSIYKFYDNTMDFDLNERKADGSTKYLLNGQAAKVHFNTGKLAGMEFSATYKSDEKSFVIAAYTDDKSQSYPDPDTTAFRVSVGDEYVILDINMPDVYISNSEKELLTEALVDMKAGCSPSQNFEVKVRELYLKKYEVIGAQNNFFNIGDFVVVDGAGDAPIQVLSFTRNWLLPYNYTIELANIVTINYQTQVINALQRLSNVVVTNKLNDAAKTKRNWRVSEEIVQMVNSLQLDMLSIGNNAGQYDTTIQFEFNYSANINRIVSTSGSLVHSYYNQLSNVGIWLVSASDTVLVNDTKPYFIYIKASKTDATASITYSETQISVEEITGFYHFPYCIISSVIDGERTPTTFKGYTQIIGDSIRTGHIKGNALDINLNDGEVTGIVNMLSGLIAGMIKLSSNGVVTAGLQGDSAVNVGAWFGGTYEEALAGLAKIIEYKDGSFQFGGGSFRGDAAGNIITDMGFEATEGHIGGFSIFENSIMNDTVEFADEEVETLDQLLNPVVNKIIKTYTWHAATTGKNAMAYTQPLVLANSGSISFAVTATAANPSGYANMNLRVLITDTINTVVFSDYTDATANGIINNKQYTVRLPSGTYNIQAIASHQNALSVDIIGEQIRNDDNTFSEYIRAIPSSNRNKLGNNGMFSFWNKSNYHYYSAPFGFKHKGSCCLVNTSYQAFVDDSNPEPIISNINQFNSFILNINDTDRVLHLPAVSEFEIGVNDMKISIITAYSNGGQLRIESKTGATLYDWDGNAKTRILMSVGDSFELHAIRAGLDMKYYITQKTGGAID